MNLALLITLAIVSTGNGNVSRCDRPACIRKCEAQCDRFIGTPDAGRSASCRSSCPKSCDDETVCENSLGYRLELHGGAHVSYGIGAALVPGAVERGFRQHLELAATLGPGKLPLGMGNSIVGDLRGPSGPLFGASGLLGLGNSPSYALAEGGYGSESLAGIAGMVGVGARLSHGLAPVAGLRAHADFLFLNVGIRTLVSFERSPDLLICFTIGAGRY